MEPNDNNATGTTVTLSLIALLLLAAGGYTYSQYGTQMAVVVTLALGLVIVVVLIGITIASVGSTSHVVVRHEYHVPDIVRVRPPATYHEVDLATTVVDVTANEQDIELQLARGARWVTFQGERLLRTRQALYRIHLAPPQPAPVTPVTLTPVTQHNPELPAGANVVETTYRYLD